VLLNDGKLWGDTVKEACKNASEAKGLMIGSVDANVEGTKETLSRLEALLLQQLQGS